MERIKQIQALVSTKSRNELIEMCKKKNVSATGTKHDMACRLIGEPEKKLKPFFEKIVIRKNKDGLWVFQDVVFDDKTKYAVSCLDKNGRVVPLDRKHIEICQQYKFKYVLPEVLDERPDPVPMTHDSSDEEEEEEFEEDLPEEDDEF